MAETQEITRGEVLQIVADFAAKSSDYRTALMANPREVLSKQMGQEIPSSVNVKVVEDSADTVYLVAPYVASAGELSDSDLEQVAGGLMKVSRDRNENQNRYSCNVTAGIGTRNEINIGSIG